MRKAAVTRNGVEDTETAIEQEQEDMRKVENVGLTTRESKKMFQEMMVAMGDSLSDLAYSDDEDDGDDDNDDDTVLVTLSKNDEPRWVISTMPKMSQQRIDVFQQK